MKRKLFHIGILGLTQIERLTVASVCSLTQSRACQYQVLPPERCVEADIMLVDGDDERALQLWLASPVHREGRPALLIGRDPTVLAGYPHVLPRSRFAARLVRQLDQMTLQELRYFRDMTIGADAAGASPFGVAGRRQENDLLALDAGMFEHMNSGKFSHGKFSQTGMHTGLHALPRVLVIDDCVVVQAKMRALLGMHGLSTDLVDNAEQGIELMRDTRYAIVFLDIVLPGMDGYAACRRMKARDRTFTPIVMLSSRDSALDKMRGRMAGCNRYLTKPIAVESLLKVLHDFIPAQTLTLAAASVSGAHRALSPPASPSNVSDSTVIIQER